ncbi:MAG: hypothetical protein G01um101456_49 [Parcubacteria group bacterium Gr01-1014_56]|nr:MAG: hypothetical protein G01um101456_49 [Parcubacteria group bacterium Gr01-1014_56]
MLSARNAAKRLSCAQDYVSKLCREGKLRGTQIQGAWFVEETSIKEFELTRLVARKERSEELARLRKEESKQYRKENGIPEATPLAPEASVKRVFSFLTTTLNRKVALALGIMLLFGAVAFAGGAGYSERQNQITAALAQVDSPFFGAHPISISIPSSSSGSFASGLLSNLFSFFFAPKNETQLAQTPTAPVVIATSSPKVLPSVATVPSIPRAPQNPIVQNNTYPVVERTLERVVSGVSEELLTSKITELAQTLRQEIFSAVNGVTAPSYSSGGVTNNIALTQIIDKLDGVTITNATITGSTFNGSSSIGGGTIDGSGVAKLFAYWVDGDTLGATSSPAVSYITATSTIATSTFMGNIAVAGSIQTGIINCSEALETNAAGIIVCGTDQTATGQANPFTWSNNYGVLTAATSSPIWAQAGLFASSTSHLVNLDFNSATSTGLSYFTGGLISSASSTVGDGTQTGGLTVSGGATTTGNVYVAGNVGIGTTSPFSKLSIQGGNVIAENTSSVGFAAVHTTGKAAALAAGSGAAAFTFDETGRFGIQALARGSVITLQTSSSDEKLTVLGTGNVGIGTTAPAQLFSVHGNGYISSSLFVGGAITSTSSAASTFPYASTTALTVSGTGYFGTASTTNFTISSIATGNLLKTTTAGSVIAAVAGTDYANFAWPFTPTQNFGVNTSATSTPLFATAGLFASSTSRFSEISVVSASTTDRGAPIAVECNDCPARSGRGSDRRRSVYVYPRSFNGING